MQEEEEEELWLILLPSLQISQEFNNHFVQKKTGKRENHFWSTKNNSFITKVFITMLIPLLFLSRLSSREFFLSEFWKKTRERGGENPPPPPHATSFSSSPSPNFPVALKEEGGRGLSKLIAHTHPPRFPEAGRKEVLPFPAKQEEKKSISFEKMRRRGLARDARKKRRDLYLFRNSFF